MVFEFWSLSQLLYYPTAWSKYRMQFFGFERLLDLDSGKILWQHKCEAPQDNKDTAPSLDELMTPSSLKPG